jgi:hypothetical protein
MTMKTLQNNPQLIALKQEFGKREAQRIRDEAKKLRKAVQTLFTPPPILKLQRS